MIKIKLENHILKKYNLEVKLDGEMTYGFLPKPHFFIKDTAINYLGETLAKTDFTKIYISVDNFFSIDNLKIKNLFFKRTEFNINYKNYNFFKQTLNSINDKDNVNFRNSRLFYNNNLTIYEGKKDKTSVQDVFQLMMYWNGCIIDGVGAPNIAYLIAKHHPPGVIDMIEKVNTRFKDMDNKPYKIEHRYWKDEGQAFEEI